MSFSSVSCAACGAVRLSQALTIVFGALPDRLYTPRYRYPSRGRARCAPGAFCSRITNAFWGSEAARHLGPTPRDRLKFGRILACRTRTTQNRRGEGAHRSVTGPLSAASARDMCARVSAIESVFRGPGAENSAQPDVHYIHTALHTPMLTTGYVRSGALAVGG